jgi:hypothetical protein
LRLFAYFAVEGFYENGWEKILTAKDAKKGRKGREETTGSKDDFSLSPKG